VNAKKITTFSEYISDESRVSLDLREKINFETALIGKMVELREKKGLSQRELADLSGLKRELAKYAADRYAYQGTPSPWIYS
jgi:hypothetical protein